MAYTKKKSTEIKVEVIPYESADNASFAEGEVDELERTIGENARELVDRTLRDIPSIAGVKQVKITITAEDN